MKGHPVRKEYSLPLKGPLDVKGNPAKRNVRNELHLKGPLEGSLLSGAILQAALQLAWGRGTPQWVLDKLSSAKCFVFAQAGPHWQIVCQL